MGKNPEIPSPDITLLSLIMDTLQPMKEGMKAQSCVANAETPR
jgi:hypothetical protein